MKPYPLFLLLCFFGVLNAQAQGNILKSLERNQPGCGTVTIHQDARIAALLGVERSSFSGEGEQKVLKTPGYRIQLYAGNNSRQARTEAFNMSTRVREYFPDLSVYTHFASPRWLCRVGDFKSIEEADAMMRKIKNTGAFREVSIVKEQIIINL